MSIITESLIRASTLNAIRMAMNIEQIGSAIIHPNACIRHAETMTPTLPRVSAKICRNTPYKKEKKMVKKVF